jgi:hypothetical protein
VHKFAEDLGWLALVLLILFAVAAKYDPLPKLQPEMIIPGILAVLILLVGIISADLRKSHA